MLMGLLTGGITLGIAAVFPPSLVLPFFAAVMGLTMGVGPGIAMGNPERGRIGLEWATTLFLMGLGLVGLWISPLLLGMALALHSLWSLLRRFTGLDEGLPEVYSRFCVSYDLVLAGFVTYIWAVGP